MTTVTMTSRMLGAETEYFFAAFLKSGQRGDPMTYLQKLIELAREIFGAIGGPGGCYLPNGSRLYIDCGHPELATCECTSPLETVKYILAGDRILAELVEALKSRCPEIEDAVLSRCHVDYSGSKATWGSHESFLHRTNPQTLQPYLLHHLASRVIYSGAGGLDSLSPQIEFQIEPRAPHLTSVVSGSSTSNRGLFHTKNETLSSAGYNRLHLLASATACSQTAMLLRLGTTCLLVALADLGKSPSRMIQLTNPLHAMRTFSRDVTCTAQVPTADGRMMSAIEIQRVYLEEVTSELEKGNLPEWAADVCDTWEMILDKLEKNPMDLVRVLDWPLKLMLLRDHCTRSGIPWDQRNQTHGAESWSKLRNQLCEIDVRFSEIGDKGIFEKLDSEGVLEHRLVAEEDVKFSMMEPPKVGRAKLRGKWVKNLTGVQGAQCDWQSVFDPRTNRRLDLSDPFQEEEIWIEPQVKPKQPVRPNNAAVQRANATRLERLARLRARQRESQT